MFEYTWDRSCQKYRKISKPTDYERHKILTLSVTVWGKIKSRLRLEFCWHLGVQKGTFIACTKREAPKTPYKERGSKSHFFVSAFISAFSSLMRRSLRSENSISDVFQRCSATNKKLWTIKVVQLKMQISDLELFSKYFSKFSFFELKWYFFDRKLNINIVLSLKTPFLRFSRDSKAKLEIWYFYFMKKVIFSFLLDHFDGPQLFVGDRTSLENARNGVFRSSRYGLKKISSKIFEFW